MSEDSSNQQSQVFRHIPNGITASRIVIAAIFPFCPETWHFILVMIGLATEFLDGFLARLFNWTSYLGQVLDPIADKLFVLSVSLTWIALGQLGLGQWLMLGLRDFGVLLIFITLIVTGKVRSVRSIKARFPSKVTTAFQYLVFIMVLTDNLEYLTPLAMVTAVIGLAATIQYSYLVKHSMR